MVGRPVARPRLWPRRIAVWAILAGLGVALLAGCRIANGQAPETRHTAVVTLTPEDNGKAVEVHAGDIVILRLDENPATGFQWAIDKNDNASLALQSSDYLPAPGPRLGGGGQKVLTFTAQQAGTVMLQLKYWRQWEGDASIRERFAVTVWIKRVTGAKYP